MCRLWRVFFLLEIIKLGNRGLGTKKRSLVLTFTSFRAALEKNSAYQKDLYVMMVLNL